MRLSARRGQALVQVIVTLTTLAVIAAALMQLGLMRLTVADRIAGGGQGKMATQSSYQLLLDDWMANGICDNNPGANGFSCTGSSVPSPHTCVPLTGTCCSCTGNIVSANGTIAITVTATPGATGQPANISAATTNQ